MMKATRIYNPYQGEGKLPIFRFCLKTKRMNPTHGSHGGIRILKGLMLQKHDNQVNSKIEMKTHLSSHRPKQSRKTAISSLPPLCWVVQLSKFLATRESSPDYLRTRTADTVSLRSKAALPTGTPHPSLAPAASFLKPPHPYSASAPRPLPPHPTPTNQQKGRTYLSATIAH